MELGLQTVHDRTATRNGFFAETLFQISALGIVSFPCFGIGEDYFHSNVEEALVQKNAVGLAVSTRPDCISDETADYLGKLVRL